MNEYLKMLRRELKLARAAQDRDPRNLILAESIRQIEYEIEATLADMAFEKSLR